MKSKGRRVFPRALRIANSTLSSASGLFLLTSFSAVADELYGTPPPKIGAYLDKLVSSYSDWIAGHDGEYLILKNRSRFLLSDGRTNKSFEELIEHPDIDDMFYVPYPAGTEPRQPTKNFDPGRVRFDPLFVTMYGDCKKNEVVHKLRTIDWLPTHGGGHVAVTMVNGVDKALEEVSRELDGLSGAFFKFLKPSAGTYNCRNVAGSRAMSMHGFGAAIDFNPK
jgi:hypothetical protein